MKVLLLALALLVSTTVEASLSVAATTSNMGMLARTVGGDAVSVRVMAPPDRDAHQLEARPSMMAALRQADIVVAVGAELEVGWLPAAIRGAANPRVQPGSLGYFEAAAHVDLIDQDMPADRRLGDVHPAGNPHIYFDPIRFAAAATALAEQFAQLQPARAEQFRANAEAFGSAVEARLPQWQAQARQAPGVVLHHKDADYLMQRLGVPVLGYIELLPGVPPTARHLRDLSTQLARHEPGGRILYAHFESSRGPDFIGRQLGWSVHALPTNVALDASAEDYLEHIDAWVDALGS